MSAANRRKAQTELSADEVRDIHLWLGWLGVYGVSFFSGAAALTYFVREARAKSEYRKEWLAYPRWKRRAIAAEIVRKQDERIASVDFLAL